MKINYYIKNNISKFKNNLSFISKNIINSLLLSYLLLLLINKATSDFANKIFNSDIILWITAIFIIFGLIFIKPREESLEIKKGNYILIFLLSLLGSLIFYFNFTTIDIYSIILSITVFIFLSSFSIFTVYKMKSKD